MALGNFEQVFAVHRHPEWRYIAYDLLKQMLGSPHSGSFLDTLLNEIAEVDAFFQHLDAAGSKSEQLATFAMLNHLAVKRILQKHATLCSSALESQRNAEFWRRLCESVVFMSKAVTLSRRRQVAEIFEDASLEDCLECSSSLAISPELEVVPADIDLVAGRNVETTQITIMTWNTCAITFPLQINPVKFFVALLLGRWWHDSSHDAPMEIYTGDAQRRYGRQAEYIRESGADLVLLQEVLSTDMLDSLMFHLSEHFACSYERCSPRIPAVFLWTCFLIMMGSLQSLILELIVSAVGGIPMLQADLFWTRWLLLTGCLSITSALRWRHSIPAHFLFGNIAGQLVVLRRKSCAALSEDWKTESFETFAGVALATTKETMKLERPSWLGVFFNLRPRGVLRVSVPLGNRTLTVLNTHLPHMSDNTKLLADLGSYASKFAARGAVLLAGDFNPLPDVCLSKQLEPLVRCGLVSADGLNEQNHTWDLQQSLTRRNASTPRNMQLDFIFLKDQQNAELINAEKWEDEANAAGCKMSLLPEDGLDLEASVLCSTKAMEITILSTGVVDREKFFRAPLSDHYGLLTDIELSG